MMRSTWDHADRAPLRIGLAVVAAGDLLSLVQALWTAAPAPQARGLALIGTNLPALAAVAGLGVLALALFGAGKWQFRSGLVGLIALGLVEESHTAIWGGPKRAYFISGTLLVGWLFGLGCAYAIKARQPLASKEEGRAFAEYLADMGAVGCLVAVYVDAGISKLVASGPAWFLSDNLQSIVLSLRPVEDDSLSGAVAVWVAARPTLAHTLSALGLVMQLTAPLYLFSRRLRLVMGSLFIFFHLCVKMLVHISYSEAIFLGALFTYPWPQIIAWLRHKAPTVELPIPENIKRSALVSGVGPWAVGALAVAALAWSVVTRPAHSAIPQARAIEVMGQQGQTREYPGDIRALLSGLKPGDAVGTFVVGEVWASGQDGIVVVCARKGQRATVQIAPKGRQPFVAPQTSQDYDLFYRQAAEPSPALAQPDVDALLTVLRDRVAQNERVVPRPALFAR